MKIRSGYLLTEDAEVALELCGTEGVRYAARLQDGRGFAAFDVDSAARLYELAQFGTILSEVPPEEQEGWEWITKGPKGPKRQVAHGDERFVLYPVPSQNISALKALDFYVQIYAPRAAALVWHAPSSTFYILIETGPEWHGPSDTFVWDCRVVNYRDTRLEVSA